MDNSLRNKNNAGRSEIRRYRPNFINDNTKDSARFSYYTLLNLEFNGKLKQLPFKLDTGSPFTIIGLNLLKKHDVDLTKETNKNELYNILLDASGRDVRVAPYIVQYLKLTDEISLNNVVIHISPDISDRAILGMDLLSLFDFQYQWEVGSMIGTFWINNYKERQLLIEKKLKEKQLEVLDSKQIFLLDNQSEQT